MTYVIINFIGECIDYKNWFHVELNDRDFVGVRSGPTDEWTCQQCSNLIEYRLSTSFILITLLNTHFDIKETLLTSIVNSTFIRQLMLLNVLCMHAAKTTILISNTHAVN